MWTSSRKIAPHLLIPLQLLLSLMLQTAGLLSDSKTCGDQACARLMCRVQALRDHRARDCRFLSFKKGDMIDVYHKLSRRRSELWAGSKDKDFGYFPKDAVKLDEVFVDEKKEMEMQTQETDFLCMDAFGTIIPSEADFEDHEFEDQNGESEDLGNSDFDDRVSKSSEPNENVEAKLVDNNKDKRKQAEQSPASWIGAAVSGWFANDAGDMGDKEENIRSRTLAIPMDQLGEKWKRMKALDLAEDQMSSALELKEKETEDDEKSTSELEKVFEAEEDTPSSETNKLSQNENMQILSKEQEIDSLKEDTDLQTVQTISEDDKIPAGHEQKHEVRSRDDRGKNGKLGERWYGSVYNRIIELYGDTPDESAAEEKEGGGASTSKDADPNLKDKPKIGEENMTEDDKAGWYSSIYSRISNVYGDPSDSRDVPDVMRQSQSQTQTESTKETSPTGRDGLPEAGINDETKTSESMTSKTNFLSDQNNDSDILELSDKKNTENLRDSSHVLSIKHISKLPSKPFKKENTPDNGEEQPSDEDDEFRVRLTELNVEEEKKNEEEAVREAQTHAIIEGSLDCNKQDTYGEPGWARFPKHISEELQTEIKTRSESWLQITENNVNAVEESKETQDEDGRTDETTIKKRRDREQINHPESNTEEHGVDDSQAGYSEENQSVNIALMKDDKERAGGEVIQLELHGNKESVDVTPVESAGEIKDSDAKSMENDGEEESSNIPQMESAGKNTIGEVTQVKNTGEQGRVNNPQNKTDRQNDSVNVVQRKNEGETGGDVTQVKSNREKKNISFTQMASAEEKKDEVIIQTKQLSLHNAQTQNSDSVYLNKGNEKINPDESRGSETPESAELQWSPSTHASGTDGSTAYTSDKAQTQLDSKKQDVKHHKTQTLAQMQKPTYANLQTHLSEKDIQVLLRVFSGETLTRLDFIIGHSADIHSKELVEVHDFKQMLEHLLKTKNEEIKPSLQFIHTLLAMLPKTFRPVITDGSVDKHPDLSRTECVTQNTPISEQDTRKDYNMETNSNTDDSLFVQEKISVSDRMRTSHTPQTEQKTDPHLDKESIPEESIPEESIPEESIPEESIPEESIPEESIPEESIPEEPLKPEESRNGASPPYTAVVGEFMSGVLMYTLKESLHTIRQVVMSLPDDIRPGPDLYGVSWEAVLFTALLGFLTFLLFTCRFFQAIKSRFYCSKERKIGQKVAELLEEKCKVLQTLSECEHKFKKLHAALQNGGLSAQASEREDLEVLSMQLEEVNALMQSDMEKMQEELETQDQLRKQQEEQMENLAEMLKKLEQEAMERKSQLEQDKTTLKIHQMNTERLQKKLQQDKEENSMLQETKAQLEQEAEGWKERLKELEEEKKLCEMSHNRMMENCINKDESIKSLTECLLKVRDWDPEEMCTVTDATGSEKVSPDLSQKQKVQKLINAAKMSADLKAVEEDKDRMFAKLSDEIKAKEDLQGGLDQLQREKESVQSESSVYSTEIQKLQHKLQIMSEMYQEKELKLHRMLTVEEKERSQKEEQLNKAGKKISLATDELNSYRQRAKELEEELEKTNQAYKNQIASHEKKAHDNWLSARAADRDLADVKRENSVLRQRLTDWQFKLELMEKNPQAGVLHFRGERSPFGPSPLGRPSSETRPFLSPPTLMDGPPRVSPQFPMMPGGRVPPGGVEGDTSVSYSEGGSPTWERERERRGLPPPGPDPGLVYRRPLSAPFLRAPLPPEVYFNDKADSSIGEGTGFNEDAIRDNGRLMPGPDTRAGPPSSSPFPPVDPRDPHFPRRSYRPDFFPPPPPLSMRGFPLPLPPGVFPRIPLPHHLAFPPTRSQSDHVSPEPPSRPSPPGSEQPPEQRPSAHDII